ncbi:MAG TPA: M48 family metalloprotease, partial [Pyrinomonadaceae bacterium]|nr:M48 family metalloprotease [Pyrinomonadaceae bacterium]
GAAAQIAGQGVGVYFLKFSREYETEADILGAQIMARSGYDPMDLANMFRTIEQQGGGSSGGFLSSHPSPANRYARIQQEARMLRIENPIRNSADFSRVQARLRSGGRAPSMEEIARSGQRYPTGENTGNYPTNYPTNAPGGRVDYPSTRYQTMSVFGGGLRVSVPSNWRELPSGESVWFAPEGAYGQYQGQAVFTHGVNFGVANTQSRNLQQATNEFLQGLIQSNNMRQRTGLQRTTLGGRTGLTSSFSNTNEATGQVENVTVVTTQLRDGRLLFMIAVAPENEAGVFQNAFRNVLRSVQING